MKRVLFVDDDQEFRDDFQRMLEPLSSEWDMTFAASGDEGLELLNAQSFDVVVSDMKMPGMDGADFLSRARELHPETVRLILSGYSDKASTMKSVGPTHQFLTKPCETADLRATINRVCTLRALLESQELQTLVAELDTLPSLPHIYQEICAALQNPNASLESIGEIIERDLGMSAKILKIVNSAYFGLRRPANKVSHAVSYLGLETVTTLVMGVQIFAAYDSAQLENFSMDRLWRHSMEASKIAKLIAKEEGVSATIRDDAVLAATLHDVGKLVLAGNVPEKFAQFLAQARESEEPAERLEREFFHATHGEVGAYLMGLWGLPTSIVEAIAFHARPSQVDSDEFGVLGVVHVADVLAKQHGVEGKSSEFDYDYLDRANKSHRVDEWSEIAEDALSFAAV